MVRLNCQLTVAPTLSVALTTQPTLNVSMKEVNAIVKSKAISVTENGTYTAENGYGFSKVTVNVPIPSNYGLITYNGSIITVS